MFVKPDQLSGISDILQYQIRLRFISFFPVGRFKGGDVSAQFGLTCTFFRKKRGLLEDIREF